MGEAEALTKAEREALMAGFTEGWAAMCEDADDAAYVRTAPETREEAEVYADLIAPTVERILAARAAAPDALRVAVEALADGYAGTASDAREAARRSKGDEG